MSRCYIFQQDAFLHNVYLCLMQTLSKLKKAVAINGLRYTFENRGTAMDVDSGGNQIFVS